MAKKIVKVETNVRITSWEKPEEISLGPNEEWTLYVDYPFEKKWKFTFNTGINGYKINDVIDFVCATYHDMYAYEDKYKPWGHDIHSLWIENLKFNFELKVIKIGVGS